MNPTFLLDIFFVIFHSSLILFVLVGWVWKSTRKAHLGVVSLIMGSWFGLGSVHGFGYCPCTDWHWQVKRDLGESNLPGSYLKYYSDRLTGWDWNPATVDTIVLVVGLAAFLVSVGLNWRDWRGSSPADPLTS